MGTFTDDLTGAVGYVLEHNLGHKGLTGLAGGAGTTSGRGYSFPFPFSVRVLNPPISWNVQTVLFTEEYNDTKESSANFPPSARVCVELWRTTGLVLGKAVDVFGWDASARISDNCSALELRRATATLPIL